MVMIARPATLSLLVAACAASPSVEQAMVRLPDDLVQLATELRSRDDRGYEGGLDGQDVVLAEALAARAFASGVPDKPCKPPEGYRGAKAMSFERSDESGRTQPNPVLDLIEQTIRGGNRRQRDIAMLAVAKIGPGSQFSQGFLQERGGWSRQALTAVTCERWTRPDIHDVWSPERDRQLEKLEYKQRSGVAVDLMITQMLDKTLVWPDGTFASTLSQRAYAEHGLTVDRVRRLLPVLNDDGYPQSIRGQAIEIVSELGTHAEVFEEALLEVYKGPHQGLSREAARALVALQSRYAGDALADEIEAPGYSAYPRNWGPRGGCEYPPRTERLVRALMSRFDDRILDVRRTAIRAIGCLRAKEGIAALVTALEQPYWSQQADALVALGRMSALPAQAREAIDRMATAHWSALVRKLAAQVSPRARTGKGQMDDVAGVAFLTGFHRTAIEHGLPVCHGKEPGDGRYRLPWLRPFHVRWHEARVHDIPAGFPIKLHEMRGRKGYGTNTFLRRQGGWLFSTDLWHYDGDFGFVTDAGQVQRFAPDSAHAAFIVETQLGTTVLGQDVFDGGEGGVLAVLTRRSDGGWAYDVVLELPSEAFGHAFAPDGTLLVKDPYGGVAITRDRKLVPLVCD